MPQQNAKESTDAQLTQTRRGHLRGIAGVGAALFGLGGASAAAGATEATTDYESICYTPTTVLAEQIREGTLSPVEVVEAFLSRIAEQDSVVNAFIEVFPERARAEAAEAERAVERGDTLGPLHGVPFGVKDLDGLEGERYTEGSLVYVDRIAEETDEDVQSFIDAGAIPIGTTNTPEFGHMGKTDNLFAGPTSSPFVIGRNSGGSSGGSTAGVGAGLIPFGTGGDGAGSLRIPASFSGVYGLFLGAEDPEDLDPESTHGRSGVQTRTVADTAYTLDVMIEPDGDAPDFQSALDQGVDGLSIGYSPDLGIWPVDERVRTVVGKNVGAITDAGASLEDVDVDLGQSYEEFMTGLQITWNVGYYRTIQELEEEGYDPLGDDRELFSDSLLTLAEDGLSYLEDDELPDEARETAFTARERAFEGMQAVFDDYDLLVTPTLSVPPFPNDELGPTEVEGVETDPVLGWLITATFNMTGHPAASLPAGMTDEGYPVGMQLVGPPRDNATILAASAAYEEVNPWADTYPAPSSADTYDRVEMRDETVAPAD